MDARTPAPHPPRALIAHYGEIGLKGGNRRMFERRLAERLREGLHWAGLEASVAGFGARLVVSFPARGADAKAEAARLARALDVLVRTPGVVHAAPVRIVPSTIEAMQEAAALALAEAPPGTFKIETRRADKTFPMTSIDVSRAVAPACFERCARKVDVRAPDVTVRVEILGSLTYVSANRRSGPGGLPVGSGGHLLAFLSGGIDSAVAAWRMARRGASLTAVHFHNRTHEGSAVLEKLTDLGGVLAWTTGPLPLRVVPFEACQRAIVASVPAPDRMLVYRRAMLRIGAALAREVRALGFVTGDSLGQVASQTVENLRTIQAVATLPVYAPLVGNDKSEIVAEARRIGTYAVSIRPHADCCAYLLAPHPTTASSPRTLDLLEADLDWEALVAEAVAGTVRSVIAPDPAVLG